MFAELAAIAGPVGQALLGYHGQQQTNSSNETIAKDATVSNMAEAQRNRDFQQTSANQQMAFQNDQRLYQQSFQENMANTAFQRAAQDRKAAGLNPILGQTPASAPTGSAPSGASAGGAQGQAATTTLQNPASYLAGMTNSALSSVTMLEGIEKQRAETDFIRAQTGKTNVDRNVKEGEIPWSDFKKTIYQNLKQKWESAAKKGENIMNSQTLKPMIDRYKRLKKNSLYNLD